MQFETLENGEPHVHLDTPHELRVAHHMLLQIDKEGTALARVETAIDDIDVRGHAQERNRTLTGVEVDYLYAGLDGIGVPETSRLAPVAAEMRAQLAPHVGVALADATLEFEAVNPSHAVEAFFSYNEDETLQLHLGNTAELVATGKMLAVTHSQEDELTKTVNDMISRVILENLKTPETAIFTGQDALSLIQAWGRYASVEGVDVSHSPDVQAQLQAQATRLLERLTPDRLMAQFESEFEQSGTTTVDVSHVATIQPQPAYL